MNPTKEAYKEKMEAHLKLWGARLDGLKAKADMATADAKTEMLKRLDQLKALQVSAKKHVAEVEASSGDSWEKARASIEQKWNQLTGSLDALWAKISPDDKPRS